MTRPRSPVVRLLLGVLVGVLTLSGALAFGLPAPAYGKAEASGPGVRVQLESMDPELPERDGQVTLTGTITNTSTSPMTGVQAVLWRDQTPISDGAGLQTAVGNEDHFGDQVWGVPSAYQRLFEREPVLPPGGSTAFRVAAPVSALTLPAQGGVYLLGVDVVGRAANGPSSTLGRARLMLPMPADRQPLSAMPKMQGLSLVFLASRPSMYRPGLFTDEHLLEELAPTGRLTLLRQAADRPDVSWMIDPATYAELQAMASPQGYQVRKADGSLRPGTGRAQAEAWLQAFAELDRANGYRVPFATPDLPSLEHSELNKIVDRSAAATAQVTDLAELPLVVYSSWGMLDAAGVAAAESMKPTAILTANAGAEGLLAPLDRAMLVGFNGQTFAGGPAPAPQDTPVQIRQRLLAETFLTSLNRSPAPQVRVVREAADAVVDTEAPWQERITLAQLLEAEPQQWSGNLSYGEASAASEFGADQVRGLRELTHGYGEYTAMVVNQAQMSPIVDSGLARSASMWWRNDPGGQVAFVAPQKDLVRQVLNGTAVSMTVQRSVIMAGTSGSFPVTVTNRLDQTIQVSLNFTSQQPQRLSIPQQTGIQVRPNESVTVSIQPRAAGNGPVEVDCRLATPSGTPLGKRARITVEVTNLGIVGWIIVVTSGIVLAATTVLRIRQVRRERLLADARSGDPQPEEDRPTGTAPRVFDFDPRPPRDDEEGGFR